MGRFAGLLVVILALVAVIIVGGSLAVERANQSRAEMIDAQSRYVVNAALAGAISSNANLPYVALAAVFVFGSIVMAVALVLLAVVILRSPAQSSPGLIERQVIMILPDSHTAGQVWSRARSLPREASRWLR